MRSIRWSLVLYFVVLVALALGLVSWFGYQSAQAALQEKEKGTREALKEKEASTRELLTTTHAENVKRKNAEFDKRLEKQAHDFADYAVLYVHQLEPLYVFGVIGSEALTRPAWFFQSMLPSRDIRIARPPDIRFQDEMMEDEVPLEAGDHYRLYRVVRGQPFRGSPEMPRPARELPASIRRTIDEHQVYFDDIPMNGVKVRSAIVRARVRSSSIYEGLIIPTLRFVPKGPPPKQGKGFGPSFPFYIEFASELSAQQRRVVLAEMQDKLNRDLTALQEGLSHDLSALKDEMDEKLAELRGRMLWVGLGTFVALVLGGIWLVHAGLMPIERLSEAVSRVSEKDFRLQLGDKPLPTELQPIADRLRQTLEQLQRAFAREKQAAADISHELRTPLAALLTTLEVGLRKERSPEEYRELLQYCHCSGQQMTQLVERLLTLARLDAGVDTLRPREVDVAALADQCVAMVRPLAEARGLKLNIQQYGPACMTGDADKLREVITNLLHNAIEYNKPDGVIEVAVKPENGDLQMEVRDTGIGITPEARLHIFERFYRSDPSRQAEGLHAGLGLSIVKGYVDLMGGSIQVDSTVGKGSTFRVRLPMNPMMMRT